MHRVCAQALRHYVSVLLVVDHLDLDRIHILGLLSHNSNMVDSDHTGLVSAVLDSLLNRQHASEPRSSVLVEDRISPSV